MVDLGREYSHNVLHDAEIVAMPKPHPQLLRSLGNTCNHTCQDTALLRRQ